LTISPDKKIATNLGLASSYFGLPDPGYQQRCYEARSAKLCCWLSISMCLDSGEPAVGSSQPETSTSSNGEVSEGGSTTVLKAAVIPETSGACDKKAGVTIIIDFEMCKLYH